MKNEAQIRSQLMLKTLSLDKIEFLIPQKVAFGYQAIKIEFDPCS